MDEIYDVVVVGGGPAGLAGATALARFRRSVLVLDDDTPRNGPAEGVHNFLSRDGAPPAELRAAGRAEVERYGGRVRAARVETAERLDSGGFRVGLAGGDAVRAGRLLVTTGLVDELPDVPGLTELWGRDVVHCPFCHGWEVRDQPIGVLACGPMAVHQALLFRRLSPDVTVFLHEQPMPGDAEREQLAAWGIPVVEGAVTGLEITDGRLTGVRLRSGEVVARTALAVQPRFVARSGVLAGLGLEPVEQKAGEVVVGMRVAAAPTGATDVPGVWVAGNVADVMAQVMPSAGAGLMTGAAILADILAEETAEAVAAYRTLEVARV